MVSLARHRQERQELGERDRMAQQIHWLMGDLERYLSEKLLANFSPTQGAWSDLGHKLTLEQLHDLEARLRGIESELTALREDY